MTHHPALRPVRAVLCLAAALACLLHPCLSAAQVITGGLIGTVHDEQNLALVGAQVTVSSPSLIGGSRTGVTDAEGRFRFPALPSGSYVLDVEMPKFASRKVREIPVRAGEEIEMRLGLKVGSVEVVDVAGSSADRRNPGLVKTFDFDTLAGIPTRRGNGPFVFVVAAPGISPTSQATSFISAFGSGVDQNLFHVDGTNVTAASNGIARSEVGIDFIQEISVKSVGSSAEYGNAQGAVIDIIMRQGSNRFLWDGSYYGQPAWMTSQPLTRPFKGIETGYERRRYRDATTTLGGPVARDRVWFFAGYQSLRDEDSQPGADPEFPKEYEQDKFFGKLTWRLAPHWHLVQSLHYETWDNRELPTAVKLVEATQRVQASVPAVTFGNLTHTPSPNRVFEVSAGRFAYSQDISRVRGDENTPGRVNPATGEATGAPMQVGELEQSRWTAKATLSQFQPDVWGGDHELKVGGQIDRGEHRSLLVVPTGVRYVDNAQRQAIWSDPSNAGGLFVVASVFATDAFTIRDRATITAGLRFDYSRAISPDVRKLNADGSDAGDTIQGQGLLYTWNTLSPRIGAVVKLTADGRTMLRGSYGRFRQGILTGELSLDHPGMPKRTTRSFDPATGDYTRNETVVDPTLNTQIDSGTRAPRTDAYSIGVDRLIGRVLSASLVYVRKNGRDFIGWEDRGGQYEDQVRTVDGQDLEVKVLTNTPSERLFTVTNPKDYSLTYNGVAMVVEKRRSQGWQASGSYTWSRATGLQPSSGTSAAGAQVATVGAPPVSFTAPVTYGQDPNALTNADGRLPNDRPHLFRLMGTFDVPKVGVVIAGNLQYSSGKPWAKTAELSLSVPAQTAVRVLLEPRGTQRLSSQTLLDLRASKAFTFGGLGRVELRADFLNLLNDTAAEAIASDLYNGSHDGTVFLDPRRVMLSVKVNLGK